MVHQLRDRGISVLASGILCAEHHTAESVQEEIDFLVGLESDLIQFMLFTALPVTQLYKDFQARGVLRTDLPYEEWHGQKYLNYEHAQFPGDAPERILNEAFRRDYEVNVSSAVRITDTVMRGYKTLLAMKNRDECLDARLAQMADKVIEDCQLLPLAAHYAVNDREREKALALDREQIALLGPPDAAERWRRFGAMACGMFWALRRKLVGDVIQPSTIVTHYWSGRPC
jgi:hypothetical protein